MYQDTNSTGNKKVLVLGGCHVSGYKVGEASSFSGLLKKDHGWNIIETGAHVSFKKLKKILPEKMEAHDPGFVLLQTGNYEFNASLRKVVRKVPAVAGISNAAEETAHAPKSSSIIGTGKEKAKQSLLTLLHWLYLPVFFFLWTIGGPSEGLEWIHEIPELYPGTEFLLLSPFPCRKRIDSIMRRLGGWIMQWKARNYRSITYLNCYSLLNNKRYFIDQAHLNEEGHQVLAGFIAKATRKAGITITDTGTPGKANDRDGW